MVYDVIIIGGGPAGLIALKYAINAKLNALLIERTTPGGKIINFNSLHNVIGYENREGFDFAIDILNSLGDSYKMIVDEVTDIKKEDDVFVVTSISNTYAARYVLVTTGTSSARLGFKNEAKYYGKGLSSCATCDASLYKNKEVYVSADANHLEEVKMLSQIVSKIYYNGETELVLDNLIKVARIKEANEKNPIILELEDKSKIRVSGIFNLNTPNSPNTSFLDESLLKDGYLVVDTNQESLLPGIFGAGDVTNPDFKQVYIALGESVKAMMMIIKKHYGSR